jgi:hypothetical protein
LFVVEDADPEIDEEIIDSDDMMEEALSDS